MENRARAAAVEDVNQLGHYQRHEGHRLGFGQLGRIVRSHPVRQPEGGERTQADQQAAAEDFPAEPAGKNILVRPSRFMLHQVFFGLIHAERHRRQAVRDEINP
ncbi:hypothetical protein D1872_263620 [compost metagenome]